MEVFPSIEKIIQQYKPDRSILSSVINHDPGIEKYLASATEFHKLDHHSKIPITTPVGKPETIGTDRLALSLQQLNVSRKKQSGRWTWFCDHL